uniref:Sulfotransferase n=1 Tax=Plectus sambesii TaxID=2011161 RepID=A0A914WKF9_9BILA
MRRVLVLAKARTGSTPFIELLASHPQIEVRGEAGELLNIETQQLPTGTEALYDYVDAQLAAITKKDTTAVAFKLFPDHLLALGLRLDDLVHHCGIETIIVVWRENIVESAVSELIARATGSWHSMTEASKTERIGVEPEKLKELIEDVERDWATAFASWPIEIPPIFVQFEQLFASDTREDINTYMAPIFHQIGVRPYDWAECYAKRQNPAPMAVKVTNWSALPKELQQTTISVPNLLHKAIGQRFGLPSELIAAVVPDREPSPPTSGSWAYRVAEPYLPPSAVQFVQEALETNSVSSAGVWPQRLTTRLKTIFGLFI